jgi:phosphoribosylaminoimidazole-succinocarboxamide synthase
VSALPVVETHLSGARLLFRGKVRDIYDLGDTLLIVATDRISAFDVILPTPIPDKGKVLTQLSVFWFRRTAPLVRNHLLTTDLADYPRALADQSDILAGRSMLVRKAKRIDVECVVRGYLAGSAWTEYQRSQTVCGQQLPAGLLQSERLPEPIFTPATKAATGHDQNISIGHLRAVVGDELTDQILAASLKVYRAAQEYAASRGLILADTKMEFGVLDGQLILIDELLTPDSSRYWDGELYDVGRPQPSYDKQYVRDWLELSDWDKVGPPPALPPEVVARTLEFADYVASSSGAARDRGEVPTT